MDQGEAHEVQQRHVQDPEENNSMHQYRPGDEKQLCRKDVGDPGGPKPLSMSMSNKPLWRRRLHEEEHCQQLKRGDHWFSSCLPHLEFCVQISPVQEESWIYWSKGHKDE